MRSSHTTEISQSQGLSQALTDPNAILFLQRRKEVQLGLTGNGPGNKSGGDLGRGMYHPIRTIKIKYVF